MGEYLENSIVGGIQSLKTAQEYFEDFRRHFPDTRGDCLLKKYSEKISWILKDFITCNCFDEVVRGIIKREIESDLLAIPEITKKISLLEPEAREAVEDMIDTILKGAELIVEDKR